MALGGGGDRRDLRPVNHYRNIIGNHKGSSSHMNVENPQPGYSYRYELAKRNKVRQRMHQGWELVNATHQEKWGDKMDSMGRGTGMDSSMQTADVVLMRIPHDKLRELREEKRRRAELALKGAESDYLDRGERMRDRMGNLAPSDPLHYRRGDHT